MGFLFRSARWSGVIARAGFTAGAYIGFSCLLAGCQGHDNNSSNEVINSGGGGSTGIMAGAETNNMKGTDVIATVNGDPITAGMLYEQLQTFIPARVPSYPQNPILAEPAGQIALQNLIVNTLYLQLAHDNGVGVQQSDLDTFYNFNKMLHELDVTIPFDKWLQQQGYSVPEYEQEILARQVAEANLLGKTVIISPDDIKQAYQKNIASYTLPFSVHIRRIACPSKDQAQDVYNKLKAGTPMSSLASLNIAADGAGGDSDDDTDIAQWINPSRPNPAFAPFAGLLKTAKAGQVLPPVVVQGQLWVIQVAETRPERVLTQDEVKDLVRLNLIQQKAQGGASQQLQATMLQYMQRAQIKIAAPQYQAVALQIHTMGMSTPPPTGAPAPPPVGAPKPGGGAVATPPVNKPH